ncbi:MAG: WD40 repeat domain-containing protein [Polyangiales bacterium]
MKTTRTTFLVALAGLVIASSATVNAVGTEKFELDTADAFFGGELEGTAIHSDGTVRVGAATTRTEIKDVPIAYSLVSRGDDVFVGTGTQGTIYHFRKGKLRKKFATGELLVSSLAFGRDGALYAGTLPNGRVFRVDPKASKITLFSTPAGAKHIWALRYDSSRGRLVAGTGPEGTIFTIDSEGIARVLHKGDASHVMSLTGDGKGTLYAGTSDSALVLQIDSNDSVSVLHDFPGNEVTAIDFLDGQLAVTANEFKTKPGTQFNASAQAAGAKRRPGAGRPRPGKGELWRVGRDGRVEKLFTSPAAHLTAVQWGADGNIYVGGGAEGHVLQVAPDASYAIWADVEERQVLGLSLRSKTPAFITGDGASVYWVRRGIPAKPVWTSKTLDTGFASKWGRLTWRGNGKLVFQTRSGNTEKPDDTWSPWSKKLKEPSRVASPPARFAQVRALFPSSEAAELRVLALYYLPQNQRARVSSVAPTATPPKPGKPKARLRPASPLVNLAWKVFNPDNDALRFRLSFRKDDQDTWRPMFLEEVVLNEPKYVWNTDSVPDGYYVVRVETSDEEANPENLTLRSEATSQPILVDNHPPRIDKLAYRNGRVQGGAVDSLGPIARLQVSIDSGPWRDIFPKDLLLDSRKEEFEITLGDRPGTSHIVAVRAFDAAGNRVTAEITVKTR